MVTHSCAIVKAGAPPPRTFGPVSAAPAVSGSPAARSSDYPASSDDPPDPSPVPTLFCFAPGRPRSLLVHSTLARRYEQPFTLNA